MHERWMDLMHRWVSEYEWSRALMDMYHSIHRQYMDGSRHYHTLAHIEHCLQELDQYRIVSGKEGLPYLSYQEGAEVELALWFHDIIYVAHDPLLSATNEARSAQWAMDSMLSLKMSWGVCKKISDLIEMTDHQLKPQTQEEKLITDIDLSILGQSPEVFDEYEKNIRKEYSWCSDQEYAIARKNVLRKFLRRANIFNLEYFWRRYEIKARTNLRCSIDRLESKS